MATSTQYNPSQELNKVLLSAGASKTVYALVTPETEKAKIDLYDSVDYLEMFHEAWTAKQDAAHVEFFDTWAAWSAPAVNLDRAKFPFYYPTAGASEPLRHLIYAQANVRTKYGKPTIHVFEGEYEGYKAMAEATGMAVVEHKRDEWRDVRLAEEDEDNRFLLDEDDLFFISQPSAIDGNVWPHFNEFLSRMPEGTVVADLTYVGATAPLAEKIDVDQPSVKNVVFSLSKPFGAYYDRVGGVFCREEDPGLFGNKWFKNLTSLALGVGLMQKTTVWGMSQRYRPFQASALLKVSKALGIPLKLSDVYILATGDGDVPDTEMTKYLTRGGHVRVCLTPAIAASFPPRPKRGVRREQVNLVDHIFRHVPPGDES